MTPDVNTCCNISANLLPQSIVRLRVCLRDIDRYFAYWNIGRGKEREMTKGNDERRRIYINLTGEVIEEMKKGNGCQSCARCSNKTRNKMQRAQRMKITCDYRNRGAQLAGREF